VINVDIIEISPLEHALQEVEDKSKELAGLRLKYEALAKTTQDVSTNALAMSLNTAVDAPLNSGIASYRQIFFSPDYVARNPERAELVEKLRTAIDEQVRIIDNCLKLHGLLCPPEFIPFHETLEKFFRKNFRDEIRRLAVDGMSDSITVSTRSHGMGPSSPATAAPYPSSAYEQSVKRSLSSSSTARFVIPPLNVGRSIAMTPPLESPISPGGASSLHHHLAGGPGASKQTPLQRHLAHLARHGINGVSSAPGDTGADSLSESPHNSFVNVGSGIHGHIGGQASGASVATSYMGSMGSFGSIKGRFSRFPSLNFGRKNASNS
jgi:dedicator of cytokinesis protein 3